MKLSRAWCAGLVLALSSVAAVAVGAEAGARVRASLDQKPLIKTMVPKRLVRMSLEQHPQPLRPAPARRISAALDQSKTTLVGSGTVKRRFRHTLDDKNYLGDAQKKAVVPTLAFPAAPARPKRVFRTQLDDRRPLSAIKARRLRTTLD